MSEVIKTLVSKSQSDFLLTIYNANKKLSITDVSKISDVSFAHVSNLLNRYKREGMIVFRGNGRCKYVSLTEKGKKLAKNLTLLRNLLQ